MSQYVFLHAQTHTIIIWYGTMFIVKSYGTILRFTTLLSCRNYLILTFESFVFWVKLIILILSIQCNTTLWAWFFLFVIMTYCVLFKFTKESRKKNKRNCSLMLWQNTHNLCHVFVVEHTLSCKKCDESTSLPSQ